MPGKGSIMPKEMQIAVIKRILRSLNPDLEDIEVLPPIPGEWSEWMDYVEDDMHLDENIDVLQSHYPNVIWKAKEKPLAPSKPLRMKEQHERAGPEKDSFFLKADVLIQSHKSGAKGRTYLHGRIQLTLDKDLIGRKARVTVFIPHVYRPDGSIIPMTESAW
jgi:hypothetical protein